MIRHLVALCLLTASLSLAATTDHPFVHSESPAGLDLSFGRLEWGATSLSYSQAWSGGQSFSQGLLLKDLRAPLARGLELNARFGLGFSPGGGFDGSGEQPEFVIPYAALDWRPSENMLFRVEYSRPGAGALSPAGFWSDRRFPLRLDETDEDEAP